MDHHHHDHHHHAHGDPGELRLQPVVLELGDGLGALIVETDPELIGTEVEISPAGDDGRRSHQEVLRRGAGNHQSCVLVFHGLAQGGYTLWIDDVARARDVCVESGKIAQLDWRVGGRSILAG
jgi:hypothetical protein